MDCHIHTHSMCALMCTGQQSKHFPGIHILCVITDWTPAFYVYIQWHRWGKIDEMPCEFKRTWWHVITMDCHIQPHCMCAVMCTNQQGKHLGDPYSIALYVHIQPHKWSKNDEMPCEVKKNMRTCDCNGLPHSQAFYVCFDVYRPAKQTLPGDPYSMWHNWLDTCILCVHSIAQVGQNWWNAVWVQKEHDDM